MNKDFLAKAIARLEECGQFRNSDTPWYYDESLDGKSVLQTILDAAKAYHVYLTLTEDD